LVKKGLKYTKRISSETFSNYDVNCDRDAILVGCINSGTSLFAGVVTFSVLGFMANEKGVEVKDVVDSGPGLAFLVYPEVVARLPGAPAWAILFFLMFVVSKIR
jgi:SNF family Na+-dependent transporter